MRQLVIGLCDECGTPLVRCASGYVCPNGHGRIVPVPIDRRSGPAPRATRTGRRRYSIDGLPGVYRTAVARPSLRTWPWRQSARREVEVTGNDWVIARDERGRLLWFRPLKSC